MDDLIVKLFDIGAFKTGSFKLKSGITSPIYVDLRVIISYPDVLQSIVDALCVLIEREIGRDEIKNWKVCGVPYTALPLATLICSKFGLPMIMRRKEKKEHGTAQLIEGKYEAGDRVLIIEDLVTSGASISETAADLRACGLEPTRAVLFLNREQGGLQNLLKRGIEAHSCTSLHEFLKVLVDRGRIDEAAKQAALDFIASAQTDVPTADSAKKPCLEEDRAKPKRSLKERSHRAKNEKAKKLFELIRTKRTNLIVAADVRTGQEVLDLANRVGDYICVLKLHYDVLDLSALQGKFFTELKKIASEKQFMIMEDRKYADIGAIVQRQLTAATCGNEHAVASWADFITVHSISGAGTLKAIGELPASERPGVILLAEMSTAENMINPEYTRKTVEIALQYPEVVSGFVAQSDVLTKHGHAAEADGLLIMTPGVSLSATGDSFGQQYRTPDAVILQSHVDCVIVGRDLYNASDAVTSATRYRDVSIDALHRISDSE